MNDRPKRTAGARSIQCEPIHVQANVTDAEGSALQGVISGTSQSQYYYTYIIVCHMTTRQVNCRRPSQGNGCFRANQVEERLDSNDQEGRKRGHHLSWLRTFYDRHKASNASTSSSTIPWARGLSVARWERARERLTARLRCRVDVAEAPCPRRASCCGPMLFSLPADHDDSYQQGRPREREKQSPKKRLLNDCLDSLYEMTCAASIYTRSSMEYRGSCCVGGSTVRLFLTSTHRQRQICNRRRHDCR